ncbi:MAG: sugar-binding transcriptional regulator [Anaerolineae bacterium]|nr:sugar-binding transcriptional regulator [Anaerolineae bacterium]
MPMAERAATGEYNRIRQINEILSLYYVQELTQAEIGRRLGISTTTVNRLLQQARDQGMVQVTIRTPFQYLFDLEAQLRQRAGLAGAMVIPRIADDVDAMVHTLGRAGAGYLLERLRDGDVLTIGGGTAVHAVVQALEPRRAYDVKVVPCMGAVQGRVTTDVNTLAAQLAARLGGEAYQLHAPAFVDSAEQREALLSMRPIKEILDIARRATVALLGVGNVDHQRSRFVQFTALSAEDMKRIAEEHGGVGEIAARVYDASGQPCADEYARRTVGLSLAELRQIPYVIGVAGTAGKARALLGALRGGHLDALVTDEAAARGVLALMEETQEH